MDKEIEYLKLKFESDKTNMLMYGSMSAVLIIGGYTTSIGLALLSLQDAFKVGFILLGLGLVFFILMLISMFSKYLTLKYIREKLL